MTIFRTFLKVLNKCKVPIITYTIILVLFGAFNMTTSDNSTNFVASKPDILIINNDEKIGVTEDLINYIEKNSNIIDIKADEEAINDALFYRDVNYIIYIPNNYRKDFLDNKNPKIEIKSTGDYQSSLAEMMLERYIKVANIYLKTFNTEDELISNVNNTLAKQSKIEVTSKLDTNQLSRVAFYYNFANYAILAGCVYVVCLILSSFKNEKIQKRTIISSMNYKKYNKQLLISNGLFAVVLWIFYVLLSFILLGNVMFTMHGVMYMANSLIFTICALTIAFLIGNIMNNKEAINGIVNVVALGSSFLCGSFVPMEWLPDTVLKIAHILPSYWYIKSNELLKTVEEFNFETLKPVLINMTVIVGFILLFVVITNIVSKNKRKS
ncbi:MAG: ABC transporter permease [Clostridia bacterium]|nr:ABC transporter permease [Clostridia bacterium]